VLHALNSDCVFRSDKPITYIYGRYKLKNKNKIIEDFFPTCWHSEENLQPFYKNLEIVKVVR
jgi:predicted enzyme involved in methoxymalonyl-ACP biosynthesis